MTSPIQKPTNTPTIPVRPIAIVEDEIDVGNQAIYIACLASNNQGILHGYWMDLDYVNDKDEVQECINYVLATSSVEGAKEYAFQDSNGLPLCLQGEYVTLELVVKFIEVLKQCNSYDERDAYLIYSNHYGEIEDYANFKESWQGKYEGSNIGATYVEQCAEKEVRLDLLEEYRDYIDWERIWIDGVFDNYWMAVDGHIFIFNL